MTEGEIRPLPSGANAFVETHTSPEGLKGVVAHWGERFTMDEVHQHLVTQGVDESKLSTTSGFDTIYHQRVGISREEAIEDELSVADLVARETLKANGWDPEEVDALYLGSGVPIVDDPQIDNYAQTIANRLGMKKDIKAHSTYAACTSGAHEFFNALTDRELQGKKVLVMGMEGVTALTPDFDTKRADSFSIQVFSNGAAAIAMVPGEDIILHSYKHKVVEDSVGALAAHMTYERLFDSQNEAIWQKDQNKNLSMIRYPKPQGERLLSLNQRETSMLFVNETVQFVGELYREHREEYPTEQIIYVAAHHASKPINEGVIKRLARNGVDGLSMPWVVSDGNSSAATTLIAHDRLLSEAKAGRRVMLIGYGAGASFDGGVIEYAVRNS